MSVELTPDEMVNMLDVFGRVLSEHRETLADPAVRELALLLVEQVEVTVGPR